MQTASISSLTGLIASAQPHLEAPFRRLNKRHNTFAAADASPEVEFDAGSGPMDSSAANAVASVAAIDHFVASNERRPLQIVRLFAPEAVQSQHENVTLGKLRPTKEHRPVRLRRQVECKF